MCQPSPGTSPAPLCAVAKANSCWGCIESGASEAPVFTLCCAVRASAGAMPASRSTVFHCMMPSNVRRSRDGVQTDNGQGTSWNEKRQQTGRLLRLDVIAAVLGNAEDSVEVA